MSDRHRRKVPKHWYLTTTRACPVCGRQEVYRERVYCKDQRRPKSWNRRYVWEDTAYCLCML